MIRHKIDPETTIERKEGDDAYYEYIICKFYQSSSQKKIFIIDQMPSLMIQLLKEKCVFLKHLCQKYM